MSLKIINALRDEYNLAGLNLLLLVPVVSAGNFPFPDITNHNAIDVSEIELNETLFPKWIPLVHTLDTGELKEESDLTDQGSLHKYSIECLVPKDYIYRHKQFQEILNMEHLVISKDNNDQFRIFGYSEDVHFNRGMKVKWKYASGKGSKGLNGYQVNLYYESDLKALPAIGVDDIDIETEFLS